MRVIRSAGQNVSPSDDGRLFDQIFSDGLFTETSITNMGGNNISIGAMYGDLCGRDFTTEAQTLAVVLPEGEGESTGYIYVEIDTSSEDVISVNSALAPFSPTYEDINVNGAVAQMIVAEYTATPLAVSSVTASYTRAAAGAVRPGSIATVETSPVVANHAVGDFILYGGTVYRVTAAIATGETIVPGTNVIADSIGDTLSTLNKGFMQKRFYKTVPFSGTVSSMSAFASVSVPEGKYFGFWEGIAGQYGPVLLKNGTQLGYLARIEEIDVETDSVLSIAPATSDSTTWTLFSAIFVKIG